MPFCSKCGKETLQDANYCRFCGNPLGGQNQGSFFKQPNKEPDAESARALEEQLLFSSEKVEIAYDNPRFHGKFKLNGNLSITDRRVLIKGFEFIYDPTYARKHLGMSILTSVSLEKSLMGDDYLRLQTYVKGAYVWVQILPLIPVSKQVWSEAESRHNFYDLRIKKPLKIEINTALAGKSDALGTAWFGPIVQRYKERGPYATYEPLQEIMQAKAVEIAALIKELEAAK